MLDDAPASDHMIRFFAVARKEVEAEWGPEEMRTKVKRPTQIVYKVQRVEVENLEALKKAIQAELDVAKKKSLTPVGEIRAAHKTPFGAVMVAFDTLRDLGVEEIEFYGTSIPSNTIRRSRFLPFPSKNY